MRAPIPQDILDRVMAAHDIVDVVSRHVPLEKKGRTWKALCPFHEEKTPSFTVNPDRQSFKCFGCGKGGNVFGFLMARENLSFPEAVRMLAGEKGIAIPDSGWRGERDPGEESRIEGIRRALALAQDLYVKTLASERGAATRAYLSQRGYPPEAIERFGLGLAPAAWDGLLEAARGKGVPPSTLEDAGLVLRRESGNGFYDRFRNRLMFPVADAQGRIVTYGARALDPDDTPKYLNGPETPVFKKGRTLYGLDRAKDAIRKDGHAILMEGYTDVLMAHLHGIESAVAGMGTAFTVDQARILARHSDRVVLLYDGDQAGRLAAEKSIDVLLEEGLEVRVALLPEGRDVDEVLLDEGVEKVREIVATAKDLFDFKYAELAKRLDLTSIRGRTTAAEDLASSARRVKKVLEQDLLMKKIAEMLGVSEAHLRAGAVAEGAAHRRRTFAGGSVPAGPSAGGEAPRGVLLEQTRLVAGAVFHPEFVSIVREVLPTDEIEHPGLAALYAALLVLTDEQGAATLETLSRRVATEAEASEALAGLPDDVAFADWVPDAVERRRLGREAGVRTYWQRFAPSAAVPAPSEATRLSASPPKPPSLS